jgi:hypothetical protein
MIGRKAPHPVDDAPEIDSQGPLPVLGGRLPEWAVEVALDAGVVTHEVDLAVGVQRLAGQCLHRLEAHHVGPHPQHVMRLRAELCDRLVQRRLLDVGQHHLHSLAREALGESPPHAAGRASDHRHLALEVLHIMPIVAHVRLLNDPKPWWGMLRGRPLSVAELIHNGTLTAEGAAIAAWTIEHGSSVFVAAGPSGAGKSTLATALLEFLPETAALYVTSGARDRIDVPDIDAPLYVLINELSYHMPVYLSGRAAQRAFSLLAQGARIVGTLHARSASEAVHVMCAEADVPRSALTTGFLIAVVVAGWSGGKIVRHVAELGFLPPSGEIQTLANLGLNGPHLVRGGLECLATWTGLPLEEIELEIFARAAQFPKR